VVENIPEVKDHETLDEWVATDTSNHAQHTASIKVWLEDQGGGGVEAAVAHARCYYGFAGPERAAAMIEEWDSKSAAWAAVVLVQTALAA
jgi:hypothetical protein